ncbi:MAG: hypothetical protein ABSA65_10060 [Acidimicrobiales bacterium]|jgi:hypothetical protein
MDGPDLSHLLDEANLERPSREVLEGIVRRRRRLRARRARTAATLGIVIALAGAGVGIGLSRHGGTTTSALPGLPSHPPTMGRMSAQAPSSASPGSAPEGLGWVNAGSEVGVAATVVTPAAEGTTSTQSSGRLQVTNAFSSSGASLCSVWNCSLYSRNGSIGEAVLHHLFTRTSEGVTVRAFAAVWAVAPLELVPTASAPASTPAATGTEPGSSVATPSAQALPTSCAVTQALVVEVSDPGAVGVVTVPLGPALERPIDVLSDQVVGEAEGSPIAVVVAHTTGQAVAVRADFAGGGKDVMTVVAHWAVLVHEQTTAKAGGTGSQGSATPGQATVYALSGTGSVLEQAGLPGSGALAMTVAACTGLNGGAQNVSGSSASGSPGSTGSGGSGSPSSRAPAPTTKPIGG